MTPKQFKRLLRKRRRQAFFEPLEPRLPLAAAAFGHNPLQPLDVNRDGHVSPLDALIVINNLNDPNLVGSALPTTPGEFPDVNDDGSQSPVDALIVINALIDPRPTIAATLPNDSGATNHPASRFDLLTNDYRLALNVSLSALTDHLVEMRVGVGNDFMDVSSEFSGSNAALNPADVDRIFGGPLPDGDHEVTVRISAESEIQFVLTVDRNAPVPTVSVGDIVRVAPDEVELVFGEPVLASESTNPIVKLKTVAGDEVAHGPVELSASSVRLPLRSKLSDAEFDLVFSGALQDLAGNLTEPFTRRFTVADPTGVPTLSPASGEAMVSVTRETVIRFDEPVDPATVTSDAFQLIAGGQRVQGKIRVSSTERFATFFYDQPLPASTAVRVIVDGQQIIGRDGIPLDADGDDEPGGRLQYEFRTLPLTNIANTRVFGYIYDSYNRDENGDDIPVVGATISLDANPNIRAVTDANGFFELGVQDLNNDGIADGLPAPEFFVHIDGSTAINAPGGTAYATLGKPFHSVPGQRVQLEMNHEPFDVYLPPMAMSDIVDLNLDADTEVGFGTAAQAQIRRMMTERYPDDSTKAEQQAQLIIDSMKVTYPAGSAMDENGNPATRATIVPVDPNRLPAPLIGSETFGLVVSIQAGTEDGFNLAGGSTNFDIPAPVVFPNLDGFAIGDDVNIWSFDHDIGDWVTGTTGVVTDLGIVSEGGIFAPGWHGVRQLGSGQGQGPAGGCKSVVGCLIENLLKEQIKNGIKQTPGGVATPGPMVVNLMGGAFNSVNNAVTNGLNGNPGPSTNIIQTLQSVAQQTGQSYADGLPGGAIGIIKNEINKNRSNRLQRMADGSVAVEPQSISDAKRVVETAANVQTLFGVLFGAGWESVLDSRTNVDLGFGIFNSIQQSIDRGSDNGQELTNTERSIIRTLPLPDGVSVEAVDLLSERLMNTQKYLEDSIVTEAQLEEGQSRNFIDLRVYADATHIVRDDALSELNAGFENWFGRYDRYLTQLPIDASDISKASASLVQQYFHVLVKPTILTSQSVATDQNGRFRRIRLEPQAFHEVYWLNPVTMDVAQTYFTTDVLSGTFEIPSGVFIDYDRIDQDGDGVPDLAESIVGTSIASRDTDDDGLSDLFEIMQGLDPLGGRSFPTGMTAHGEPHLAAKGWMV